MTVTDILIIIFGLVAGYFSIAKLIDSVEDRSPPDFEKNKSKRSDQHN